MAHSRRVRKYKARLGDPLEICYSIYGLHIQSNRVLSGVLPVACGGPAAPDLRLTFAGSMAPIPAEWVQQPWSLQRELQGAQWAFRTWAVANPHGPCFRMDTYREQDETTIFFDAHGTDLWVYWQQGGADAEAFWRDLSGWVVDAALGFAARLRGWPVLHGSVVAAGGGAIGLLGHKGAGKSTLAAAFLAAGSPVLADDHLVLRQTGANLMAQPGPPRLRLWPTSLPVLAQAQEDLPRVYSYLEKRQVELERSAAGGAEGFQAAALPLRAIYLLEPRDPARTAPQVEPLAPAAGLHQLLVYRWGTQLISPEHAARELSGLAQLTQSTPVRRIHRPDDLNSLGRLVQAIQEDLSNNVC